MEQYGFALRGNPFDRVDFQSAQLQGSYLSRDAVAAAALRCKQQLSSSHPSAEADGAEEGELAASAARIKCAAASIVAAAGWRWVVVCERGRRTPPLCKALPKNEHIFAASTASGACTAAMHHHLTLGRPTSICLPQYLDAPTSCRTLAQYRQVSCGSTAAAAQALLSHTQQLLASFPTSADEDAALLVALQQPTGSSVPQDTRAAGGLACSGSTPTYSPGCDGDGGNGGDGSAARGSSSSSSALRRQAALAYRLQRKLLLAAAQQLLHELLAAER